ncbi:MAG: LacI family DNA-binding transcriptional regulator [Spirochaetaceae bacterium]|nr:LacI family DNA-binding transcriptional regulator [Spirochaetaceae bacterium]MBQ4330304.1 LacI family DNA-binding transcriptional regulator [Spirochaetaceae bacterium]MBR6566887.1 LacI family DNA-binding transcriptional regulator [Spirochaetaceae bacterium]
MSVRLKDIAQETGVSISTVSRILNGKGHRKEGDKTAQLVIDAAKRMGFFAKATSHKLVIKGDTIQKNLSIGCILTSAHETFVSPFFSSMLAAIQKELSIWQDLIQYNLIVTSITDPGFSHILDSSTLDCAIVLGRTSQENILKLKGNIPVLVYAGANKMNCQIDEVICDGYAGVHRAVEYFISNGHKKIGFIGPTHQQSNVFNEHRYTGFIDAMERGGLAINTAHVVDSILTSTAAYEGTKQMLQNKDLPTAIFCANDTVALGAMRAFEDTGIRIPDDISIMGFDNIDMAQFVKPSLTTISVPIWELGRLAVKVLIDRIETGRCYPIQVTVPFQLIERESCKSI